MNNTRFLHKTPAPPLCLRLPILLAISCSCLCLPLPAADKTGAQEISFNRDIRPIFAANCFPCHGPDKKNRKARLRLDEEKGVARVFRKENLAENKAWLRINSKDEEKIMPPPDSHKELTAEEIEKIGAWIKGGAAWQGHWAYITPRKPKLPPTRKTGWAKNPIDHFVLANLERKNLEPAPEAGREMLIRRVSLDLRGLPPSVKELDAFLADKSPQAYEAMVDRMLTSPHYGERMALAWMDAARYGDSSVFHADGPRDMWPWRDWAIRAYNGNKPFDEFSIEQLAGDLLPGSTVEQKIATGFNRNNATTDEGGAIAEEFRVEYAVDRVMTTSLVWLGLSIQCAQCHDHKYEPISQEDYYRFFAYFNQASDPGMQSRGGNQSPVVNVPNFARAAMMKKEQASLKAAEAKLAARAKAAKGEFQAWVKKAEKGSKTGPAEPAGLVHHFSLDEGQGNVIADSIDSSRKGTVKGSTHWVDGKFGKAFRLDGKNYIELGDHADFDRTDSFSFGAWIKPAGNGAPLAKMNDGNKHRGWDLYLQNGQVGMHLISSWPNDALKVISNGKVQNGKWNHVFVTHDGSGTSAGVKVYINGKSQGLKVEQSNLRSSTRSKASLKIGRRQPGSPYKGQIDDVRIYGRELNGAEVANLSGSDPLAPILATPAASRKPGQIDVLRKHFLSSLDREYISIAKDAAGWRAKINEAAKPQGNVMVMADVGKPRKTYVLMRGDYASPLKEKPLEPGTPNVLPVQAKNSPANRLGLARWLFQPEHPLTARVAVNRYWYMLFGRGIVKTIEEFGSQGDWPSNLQLLDWLATDFRESDWNVKRILKQMLMSSTYRQSARASSDLIKLDPENKLLGRGPRFRLQAEFIRDTILSASGLLVKDIGGRGVKPYQPPGLWNEVSLGGNVRFVQDHGEKLYRRGMYTYWKRSSPAPSLTIFDTPTREKCVLRRSRTNTPLQALVLLNDPQYIEAARSLAQKVTLEAGDSIDARIVLAYRLATAHSPSTKTLTLLKKAYEEERAVFQKDPERAKKLLGVGESKRDAAIDAAEHAALTIICSMILNLDATVTKG
jgi:hypothetical protein